LNTIVANVPLGTPPAWAILQRDLFDLLGEASLAFEARFCRPDGSLIWRSTLRDSNGRPGRSSRRSPERDGGDDFYEPFRAWPLAYALGGSPDLLVRSQRHWNAVTRQLDALGLVDQEYCVGYDWYHQSEGNAMFQFLAVADPTDPATRVRAERFAAFLLNDGVPEPIFDQANRIFRAPHVGSGGPRWGINGGREVWWDALDDQMFSPLPFDDVPGVHSFEDMLDPTLGPRMAGAMEDRMGRGEAVVNLTATSLATTAYLVTGAEKFRRWVLDYVDGWIERSEGFDGVVPDNVGLGGDVGEHVGGRWYGANYGWTWPFGYFSVALAVTVASQNAFLLSADQRYLEFARGLIDASFERGRSAGPPHESAKLEFFSLANEFGALRGTERMWLIPYRYSDTGWFDWHPMTLANPTALWAAGGDDADRDRAHRITAASELDPARVISTFTRDDNGHERPWLEFLSGRNAGYPEQILLVAHDQVRQRVDRIQADDVDLELTDVDDWQLFNPVTVEALCQLTLGAPAPIYNGGLLFAPVFYDDPDGRRSGLPPGVAALVRRVEHERIELELVNLDANPRRVVVRAGAYSEHRFTSAGFERRVSAYPGQRAYGGSIWYGRDPVQLADDTVEISDSHFLVAMDSHSRIHLTLGLRRNVGSPSASAPGAGSSVRLVLAR
jgi:hypothetical protein